MDHILVNLKSKPKKLLEENTGAKLHDLGFGNGFLNNDIKSNQNPKDLPSPKKTNNTLLELMNEFSKIAGYGINIQKYIVFLYTNNDLSEGEIKKTI